MNEPNLNLDPSSGNNFSPDLGQAGQPVVQSKKSNLLENIKKRKHPILYALLAVIVLCLSFLFIKYYKLYIHDHEIVLNKQNCDICPIPDPCPECEVCPAVAATPAPTPSTSKRSSSSSQEEVLAPPAPPSD